MNSKKNQVNFSGSNVNTKKVSPFLKFIASIGGRIVLTFVFAVIIYGILIAALKTNNSILSICIFIVCGYFGWQSLNRITPDIFLWMPLGAWVSYFIIKALLSLCIGALVAPIWIGKKISSVVMNYVDDAIN